MSAKIKISILIVVIISANQGISGEERCEYPGVYKSINSSAVTPYTASSQGVTLGVCAFQCLKNETCFSFNYEIGQQTCQLSSCRETNSSCQISHRKGFKHYVEQTAALPVGVTTSSPVPVNTFSPSLPPITTKQTPTAPASTMQTPTTPASTTQTPTTPASTMQTPTTPASTTQTPTTPASTTQTPTTPASTTQTPTAPASTMQTPTTPASTTQTPTTPASSIQLDCQDLYTVDGIYLIQPATSAQPFEVYCEQDVDGVWTVIQKRTDSQVDFHLYLWEDYKVGFGSVDGSHWLGNQKIHEITSSGSYTLRVNLGDWEGNSAYADYDSFLIEGESDKYRLRLGIYSTSSTAGDSLGYHKDMQFSTPDQDNDLHSAQCATMHDPGSWWYQSCMHSNLNSKYYPSSTVPTSFDGVLWKTWKGTSYSLKTTTMKIKPN